MKYIKTFEGSWYTNRSNIGEIVKRRTYNDMDYVLYLITDINLNENIIKVIFIGASSLDFKNIKLKKNKDLKIQTLNSWFKNDYELLTTYESDKLLQEIDNYDNEDFFEYIKTTSNIDLKDYVIRKNMKKYNI